jgi:hypothetical protein
VDDLVKKAMAKWPHVPYCYGWLGLDARGRYFMRDEAAQHAGEFGSGNVQAKGSELRHEKLLEFIGRNYQSDDGGQWYFQNGPQRVYVELEVTPWIWRVEQDFSVMSHTGVVAAFEQGFVDELGRVYIKTAHGIGLVHTQDVHRVAEAMDTKQWMLKETNYQQLQEQFRFVISPSKAEAETSE